MKTVGVGLIGLGTIGTGFVKILQKNHASISKRVGTNIKLVQVCDKSITSKPEIGLKKGDITKDYKDLIKNSEIGIIVELIGGYEPARTIILEALKAGKHVVTANKAVLAKYWDEIIDTAHSHKTHVYFEAAVGAGIPVIQGLNEGLAANNIKEIIGVLNGTTNFILTNMLENGLSFDTALKEAQSSGFAESDPTFDIQGVDSAHKLAVLSSIAFGEWVKISDIYCEGITHIGIMDLQLAKREFGYGLKLLGIARERNGKVELRVHPTFLPLSHPFIAVNNEYNAIAIVGDAVGDVMFYGKGAGQMAAASAVVSDATFLARHISDGTAGKFQYVFYERKGKLKFVDKNHFESRYYLRFTTQDKPGVLSKISGILGKHHVSIDSVFQPKASEAHDLDTSGQKSGEGVPILLTTHSSIEGNVQKALQEIDKLSVVTSKTILIRIWE